MLTFIDWFAGVGGFRKGMENAGHKCVGFCEFDKYAVASYTSMHLITEEQREYLAALEMKKRQKEILKEEYRNGEWYAEDVRTVRAEEIPRADCWCFGFPCQDISVAGRQLGFNGHRSSLFFAVTKLIRELEEENKPGWLFIENVKNLLSVNRGFDFAKLLVELDEIGYDCEWQLLNSKDFGVPQNRERVFIIGHLRGRSGREVFPVEGTDGENRSAVNQIGRRPSDTRDNLNQYRVYDTDGCAPTLNKMEGGGLEPHIPVCLNPKGGRGGVPGLQPSIKDRVYDAEGVMPAVATSEFFNPNVAIPVFNGEQMVHAIWYEKYQCYIAIRKLTPKECFRLQGWEDEYFGKAEFVNSNSQLYKQAGNGVTVNVIEAIARMME